MKTASRLSASPYPKNAPDTTKPHPAKPIPPLISIIIPIYNAERFLPQTIQSVLKQNYPHLEVLLINDGSTDRSAQICQTYSNIPNFHFFDLPHCGVSAARNHGLKHLTGEYFCFLDADDLLAPTFISELYYFASNHHLRYVGCTYQRQIYSTPTNFPPGQPLSPSRLFYTQSEFFTKLLTLDTGYNFCHMKLLHSSLKNTYFDESLTVAEDALYNFTILSSLDRIGILQKPLYLYQIHASSTVRTFSKQYIKQYQSALHKIQHYLELNFQKDYISNLPLFYAFVTSHLFLILANFCCHPQNPHPLRSIKSLYNIPLFFRAIHLTPLRLFPAPKALLLVFFKLRFYRLLKFAGHLRSRQNLKT